MTYAYSPNGVESAKRFKYKPLYAGYPWSFTLTVQAEQAIFPLECTLAAQIRHAPDDPRILGTLTTENGGLERIDDHSILISVDPQTSLTWPEKNVVFDLIRTDLNPDQHMGIRIIVCVKIAATRGLVE
jgi:hypothetical protein